MKHLLGRLLGSGAALGARGERLAARWLRRRGYRIVQRNLRVGRDEADLVAIDPDGVTVVIVEVKTRAADAPAPEESLDEKKRFRLARLAARLQQTPGYADRPVRLDAIAIVWPSSGEPEVRHYVAAFESPF